MTAHHQPRHRYDPLAVRVPGAPTEITRPPASTVRPAPYRVHPLHIEQPRTRRPSWLRWPSVRAWLITLAVLLAVAAAGGLVWLAVLAVQAVIAAVLAVIAWIVAHWLLIALAVLGLLVLLVGAGGGGCAGLHCGGCRR
jgi:hypothetical protein